MAEPAPISRRDFLKVSLSLSTAMLLPSGCNLLPPNLSFVETRGGWEKYKDNPVFGGDYGTSFDVSVLKLETYYRMWFSWRPRKSIAMVESNDGIHWNQPQIVLKPNPESGWEDQVNRPSVLRIGDAYNMWYTGQTREGSCIGYATSTNGVDWKRLSSKPVLSADVPWEKKAVMCPHVIYDDMQSQFRLWYSGGEQYEPDAIGYAVSNDGANWIKHPNNPIYSPNKSEEWEQDKVTGGYVIRHNEYYYLFYIGFRSDSFAQIGLARSKDGIAGWERNPNNPIISPGIGGWDGDAVYKPSVIFEGGHWNLWYNGRKGNDEQIGLAIHEGEDLGFS